MNRTLFLSLIGFPAGFLSALLGIGGGIILIPCLILLAKERLHKAVAISLIAVVPITATAASLQLLNYAVNWSIVMTIIIGAIVGSWFGVRAIHMLDHHRATRIFGYFLIGIGIYMTGVLPTSQGMLPTTGIFLAALGILVGFASGFFGISGGVLLVPGLVQVFGFSPTAAVVTSLISLLPVVIAGIVFHHAHDGLHERSLYVIIPASLVGVVLGVILLPSLTTWMLNLAFAVLLIATGVRLQKTEDPK